VIRFVDQTSVSNVASVASLVHRPSQGNDGYSERKVHPVKNFSLQRKESDEGIVKPVR